MAPRSNRIRRAAGRRDLQSTTWRLAVLACVASACSPFADYEAPEPGSPNARGGTGGSPDVCQSVRPPDRPEESATEGETEFVVATRSVELGDSYFEGKPLAASIGYDLDGACTDQSRSTTCLEPEWAHGDHADYPGGRDNALGRALYELGQIFESNRLADDVEAHAGEGRSTSVIRVRGYNDGEEDEEVEVAVFEATTRDEDGRLERPKWDDRDEWHPLEPWVEPAQDGEGDLAGGRSRARYSTTNAFVVGGTLVARFAKVRVAIGELTHVVMTANITRSLGGPWVLREGTIAGRFGAEESLAALELVFPDEPLCVGSNAYGVIKGLLCSMADISSRGADDGSKPCDALSWAWSFETEPARLSGETRRAQRAFDPERARCPEGTRPSEDTCG